MTDKSRQNRVTRPDRRDDNALRDELNRFGLTDAEIDTYLAVLSRGEAATRTVAGDADVTQRAVYDIAERLQKRGFVRVDDRASPTTIRAVAPREALGNLSAKLESIRPALADRFDDDAASKAPEIRMVQTRETALRRLHTAVSEAEREALIAVPERFYPAIEPNLRAAVERGVLVFLLLGETEHPDGHDHRFDGAADAVRSWNASLPFLCAVDGDSATIGDSSILSTPRSEGDAVTVSQPYLAGAIVGLYLSAYWPAATEAYVTDPDSLPSTFEWFRRAIFQAILHLRRERKLRATVRTRGKGEVSGTVRRVRQGFVEPPTNEYTLETSLCLESDSGVSIFGGPGSFVEDYEVDSVTLHGRR